MSLPGPTSDQNQENAYYQQIMVYLTNAGGQTRLVDILPLLERQLMIPACHVPQYVLSVNKPQDKAVNELASRVNNLKLS
jgi:hypothetical protein